MDITQKLTNWIAWSSDGQKSVLKEALEEINTNRKRIETLQEVVRDDHRFALEIDADRNRLREALVASKACINDKAYTAAVMVIDTALDYKESE